MLKTTDSRKNSALSMQKGTQKEGGLNSDVNYAVNRYESGLSQNSQTNNIINLETKYQQSLLQNFMTHHKSQGLHVKRNGLSNAGLRVKSNYLKRRPQTRG